MIARAVALTIALLALQAAVCGLAAATLDAVETLYAIKINGEQVTEGAILLKDTNGRLYATAGDVRAWRFKKDPLPKPELVAGKAYIELTAIRGLRIVEDTGAATLVLSAPLDAFVASVVDLPGAELPARILPTKGSGAFMNYALGTVLGPARSLSGGFDLGVARGSANAFSSWTLDTSSSRPRLIRGDTTISRDFIEKDRSLRLGDTQARGGAFGNTVRFAGIQSATNFEVDPTLTTFAYPVLRGMSAVPSTLDVYINSVKTWSQQVSPGPFEISRFPAVNGYGDVEFVVHDALGREIVTRQSLFVAPNLLARGLRDFSYQAGLLRSAGAGYHSGFASGTDRRGLSGNTTLELHAEIAGDRAMAALAADIAAANAGIVSAGLAQSAGRAGAGQRFMLAFSGGNRRLNYGSRYSVSSATFKSLGDSPQTAAGNRQLQLNLGVRATRRTSVSIAYVDARSAASGSVRSLTAGFNTSLGRAMLNAGITTAPAHGFNSQMTVTLPLDPRTSAAFSRNQNGKAQQAALDLARSLPESGVGLSMRGHVTGGDARSLTAGLTEQTSSNTFDLGIAHASGGDSATLNVSGSLAYIDRHLFRSRTITQSFAVAELSEYAGVRVRANNVEVGRTDRHGLVFIPNLAPYRRSTIALEGADLPLGANVGAETMEIAPYARSGMVIKFAREADGGVSVRVVGSAGAVLPAGTLIHSNDGRTWPIAEDGAAFLNGIPPGPVDLQARGTGDPCRLHLVIPKNVEAFPDLGTVACRG